MGYKRPKKVYKIVFEQKGMAGLEVRARSVSLGQILDLVNLAELADPNRRANMLDDMGKLKHLFEGLASALVDWNLEDEDGTPVPATLEGLYSQDMEFGLDVALAWMDAVMGVSAPLERPSSSGGPSLEASLPMDVSSASPAS